GGVGQVASMSSIQRSARRFISRYRRVRAFFAERSPDAPLQGGERKTTSGASGQSSSNSDGDRSRMSRQSAGAATMFSKSRHEAESKSIPPTIRNRALRPNIETSARLKPSAPPPMPQKGKRAVYSVTAPSSES